ADLVDQAVIESFARVEIPAAAHVVRDFLSGAARELRQSRVQRPEQILLLPAVGGDLVGPPRELYLRPGEPEVRGRRCEALTGGSQHADDRAADLTSTMDAYRRAQRVERVDDDERRLEGAIRAVEIDIDGIIADGAERQYLRRHLGGQSIIELARDEDDPAREQFLPQPG